MRFLVLGGLGIIALWIWSRKPTVTNPIGVIPYNQIPDDLPLFNFASGGMQPGITKDQEGVGGAGSFLTSVAYGAKG